MRRAEPSENQGVQGSTFLRAYGLGFGLMSVLISHQFVASAEPGAGRVPQTNSVVAPNPPAERVHEIEDLEHPEDDFQVHVHTNAPSGSTKREEGFHWDVSWRGWNGLHLAVSQTTHLKTPGKCSACSRSQMDSCTSTNLK